MAKSKPNGKNDKAEQTLEYNINLPNITATIWSE
jgi:hypothetical protein